jgi:hypothetical protein
MREGRKRETDGSQRGGGGKMGCGRGGGVGEKDRERGFSSSTSAFSNAYLQFTYFFLISPPFSHYLSFVSEKVFIHTVLNLKAQ